MPDGDYLLMKVEYSKAGAGEVSNSDRLKLFLFVCLNAHRENNNNADFFKRN